jgi:hypothetical protein
LGNTGAKALQRHKHNCTHFVISPLQQEVDLVNFNLNTFAFLRGLGTIWLYALPLALTQTWLLGLAVRARWAWLGLQWLSLTVCLSVIPLWLGLCFGVLSGWLALLPFVALIGVLLWGFFGFLGLAVHWLERRVLQGSIRNPKRQLVVSLLASTAVWWLLPLMGQFFPLWFRLGLLVVVGVAVGQITGRCLRR